MDEVKSKKWVNLFFVKDFKCIKIELNVDWIVDNLTNSVMSIQENADRKTFKSGYDNYSDSFFQGRTLSFSQYHKS